MGEHHLQGIWKQCCHRVMKYCSSMVCVNLKSSNMWLAYTCNVDKTCSDVTCMYMYMYMYIYM